MGTQRRYKVPMFGTTYRVVREVPGEKDETLFGSDVLAEAEIEYTKLSEETEDTIFLLHRTRIIRHNKG